MAPWDPTGYWVSEIVDEWRFRVSPIKGDVLYMPINAEARRIANAWDPAKDEAEGNQCKAYGAVGLMQRPGRLHITWVDDNTIRIDADAGTQTRTLHFGRPPTRPRRHLRSDCPLTLLAQTNSVRRNPLARPPCRETRSPVGKVRASAVAGEDAEARQRPRKPAR